MKCEFYFDSTDSRTKVHGIEWIPDGEPRAILQLIHGMNEYIDRYDEFATYMMNQGFYVIGNDHVGHGKSVVSDDDYGFFKEKNGNNVLLEDLETVRRRAAEKYPDIPYFILGHSMGSFLARQFIARHGENLSGAVIMGTAEQPGAAVNFGIYYSSALEKIWGPRHRSKTLRYLTLGSNNSKFEHRTPADWLSKNESNIDSYVSNPMCTFTFTTSGFRDMFLSIKDCQSKDTIERIPKNLPLLVTSGSDDPVGNFGKGVRQAYQSYVDAGIKDVTLKLYPGDRHEILNELDREEVYQDLLTWFESHLDANAGKPEADESSATSGETCATDLNAGESK